MKTHADKIQENKSQSVANFDSQKQSSAESIFQFIDNRSEAVAQRKLQSKISSSTTQAIQKKGKYMPAPTIDAVGPNAIAELEYGSGPAISFTGISSCIGLIGRNGANVIGIHIPLKDEDGTMVSDADLAVLSGLIGGIVAGCGTLYYVGEKTVWQGSGAVAALAAITGGFTGIMFGSGDYSASIDPVDPDEIVIVKDGTQIWPV